jgi:hypothetical protein
VRVALHTFVVCYRFLCLVAPLAPAVLPDFLARVGIGRRAVPL